MESVFREVLFLDLNSPHNKQQYRLKKNELILQPEQTKITFDHICYTAQDVIDKIILEVLLMQTAKSTQTRPSTSTSMTTATVTFNYDIQIQTLLRLIDALMKVKVYSNKSFRMAHFQVRNGHIADYNKSKQGKSLIDELDKFERQIDGCLKLNRIWKVNELVKFKPISSQNLEQEITTARKYGKRANEFIIIEMQNDLRLVLMILPRCRDYVLTKQEEKEIEELFILRKFTQIPITFLSPLSQIMNSYMMPSRLNLLINSYPEKDKSIEEVLRLPLKMGISQQKQEINKIVDSYNKYKGVELEYQAEKIRKRLKELQVSAKAEEENMQKLAKVYSRTFSKTFSSLEYLKKKDVTNIKLFVEWLKKEIKLREDEIKEEELELKEIHRSIIAGEERHAFYIGRVQAFRNQLITTVQARATSAITGKQKPPQPRGQREVTEDELLYIYDPQKELSKYRQKKYEQMKQSLALSEQKGNFTRIMGIAKSKCSKLDLSKLQQKYYNLIYE